jgi:arylsulfatase
VNRVRYLVKLQRVLCAVVGTSVFAFSIFGCDAEPRDAEEPDVKGEEATRVVLITLDTMRFDTLAGAEGRPTPMPLLDAWSKRGLVMTRHYAASSTTQPTHASLLTGLHPWQHGVSRNGQVLDARFDTLAEVFGSAGYRTGAVVSSFPLHRHFGYEQGFERFDDAFDIRMTLEWSGARVPGGAFYSLARSITDKALAMVDALEGSRQFLWFHYFDLHEPYGDLAAPNQVVRLAEVYQRIEAGDDDAAGRLELARQRYEADARKLDRELDRLLTRLTSDAGEVATHVVVVSDHGEAFGEEGSIGHGKRLSEALIRVPCFVLSPSVEPGRVDVPVGSVDLPVTLLSLAQLEVEASSPMVVAGRDLTGPLSEDRSVFGMRRTFASTFHELRLDGARHALPDPVFYIADRSGVSIGNRDETFRRAPVLSPPDQRDAPHLAVSDEARARNQALFEAFARDLESAGQDVELDDQTRAALEALGYVQ